MSSLVLVGAMEGLWNVGLVRVQTVFAIDHEFHKVGYYCMIDQDSNILLSTC